MKAYVEQTAGYNIMRLVLSREKRRCAVGASKKLRKILLVTTTKAVTTPFIDYWELYGFLMFYFILRLPENMRSKSLGRKVFRKTPDGGEERPSKIQEESESGSSIRRSFDYQVQRNFIGC